MASESGQPKSGGAANIWPWALAVGLLAGFVVGREMGPRSSGSTPDRGERAGGDPAPAAAVAKTYKSEADFPSGWSKAADLVGVAGINFDGIKDGAKVAAMQALNERDCECGCGMGHIAGCAKKDPNCPRSPRIAKQVVEMARQGKTLTEMLAYIDAENPKKGAGAAAAAEAPPGPKKVVIPAHSPRQGAKNAKVTIVEFSDFQCPFCGRVVPTVKQLLEKYPRDVQVVFVNQPLPFHENAKGAAKAFLAARGQNKAWQLHDKMFANQQALTAPQLEGYAKEVGLDVAKWKKELDDPTTERMLADDQALASSVGANGTPTFFINGRELSGAQPFPAFQAIVDEEIKKADALLKGGVKPERLYERLMADNIAAAPPTAPSNGANGAPAAPAAPVKIDLGTSPVKGSRSAPVTIVAFSDFQCPFCSRAVPVIKQIEDAYKDKVRIAFKNLPLPFHDHAQLAAEASLAAHEQGKFWPYHDTLFANQQALERPSLEKYAADLGLDVGKFKVALDSGRFKKQVEEDARLAASVGATGTPTFFINGRALVGAQPFEKFKELIDPELTRKN